MSEYEQETTAEEMARIKNEQIKQFQNVAFCWQNLAQELIAEKRRLTARLEAAEALCEAVTKYQNSHFAKQEDIWWNEVGPASTQWRLVKSLQSPEVQAEINRPLIGD